MNRTQRKIVTEKLHTHGVIMKMVEHELYRVITVHGSGLSEKENLYVRKRLSQLQKISGELNMIRERCQLK